MQKILSAIHELLESMAERNVFVIVEGKKDRAVLEHYGAFRIMTLSRVPLYKIVEESLRQSTTQEICILTDLDKEGKKLYGLLSTQFSLAGVRMDNRLREFLLCYTPVSHIEGLRTYLENLEERRRIG